MEPTVGHLTDQTQPDRNPPTVGEEFVEWAEKYWRLKETHIESYSDKSELCHYDQMRQCFIEKIDNIIKRKLNLD